MNILGMNDSKIQVVLTSADINGALQAITVKNIVVHDVIYEDTLHICFSIRKSEYPFLLGLIQKRGEELEIKKRSGMINAIAALFRRPILVLGALMLLFFTCWLPTRVIFVRVEGNETITEKQIIEQAKMCGIRFGAHRHLVRSEKMKNSLLTALPELQWAGINTYGCTAVITVRERNDVANLPEADHLNSIVALRDGIIREMTVLQGNALCEVGQGVKAGQTLVSAYTDCGIYIRATGAKADIYGDTQRTLSMISPTKYCYRMRISNQYKKYSLIIGKKRINFFKGSGISGSTCAKIYEEKYITLPGGFVLPIGIVLEQFIMYDTASELFDDVETVLSQYAKVYLHSLMQAGTIQQSNQVFVRGEYFYRMEGLYDCYEMMSITRPEEAKEEYE